MKNETPIIGVFLLAQNRLLRESLTKLLNKKSDLQIVGATPFSNQAMEEIAAATPEVLLFDSMSFALSGDEFLREIRDTIPEAKIVMIGMEAKWELFLRCVRGGILGYVLEEASAGEVSQAIRSVVHGEAVCPPRLCRTLFKFVEQRSNQVPNFHLKRHLGLTCREQQLAEMIGQGLTNKQIALQLNLAEQTVRNHVHRMLRKLGVAHRLQVAELCRNAEFSQQVA